jgi:cell division protein ZipA
MKAFTKRTQAPQVPNTDDAFVAPDLKKLDAELDDLFPEIKPNSLKAEAKAEVKPAAKAAPQAAPVPQEVLVMHIMAPKGSTFYGDDLLPILMDLHMRFGDMDIFHRHAQENGTGPVLFSLANLVKPGTFELSNMNDFETPGLSLFMTLPCGEEAMHAFALMAQAAKRLTQGLGGELKDEARNNMTQQIFEHYKERVAEFERKWRLQKAH